LAERSTALPSEQTQAYAVEAVALARMHDDQRALAVALRLLGKVADDHNQALAFCEEGLAVSRAVGDPLLIIPALLQVGKFLDEALTRARAFGDQPLLAATLIDIGLRIRNDSPHRAYYARAQAMLEEAATLFRAQGDHKNYAQALRYLGAAARDQGDYVQARALLEEGLMLARTINSMDQIAAIAHDLGETHFMDGDTARAEALEQESLAISRDLGGMSLPWAALILGYVALRRGDSALARSSWLEGLAIANAQHWDFAIHLWVAAFASLAVTEGQLTRAARLFGAALAKGVWAPAEGLRGLIWPPAHRREVDQYIATVRAQLDDTAFALAWAAGQALTIEQAIAEALAEPQRTDLSTTTG
jgi:tetratricopeptide (TPR) repeat protein